MENKEIVKKAFEFNRKGFETIFEATEKAQTKAEDYTGKTVEEASFVPEQGKALVKQWIEAGRKARKDFRDAVLKGNDQLEKYLIPA